MSLMKYSETPKWVETMKGTAAVVYQTVFLKQHQEKKKRANRDGVILSDLDEFCMSFHQHMKSIEIQQELCPTRCVCVRLSH